MTMVESETATERSPELDRTEPQVSLFRLMLGFAVIYVVWGSTYLGIKIAIETIPPFLMAGGRFAIAGVLLYVALRATGAPSAIGAQWRRAAALGMLLLVGGNGLVTIAEQHVPSGMAALIVATVPLWMLVFDWLLYAGPRPSWRNLFGLVLGMFGVAILVDPRGPGQAFPLWSLAAIVAAPICWSIGSVTSKRTARSPQTPLDAALQMICGGTAMLLIGLLAGEPWAFSPTALSLRSITALVYLILFGSVLAYTTYMWLLKVASPAAVATYAYVNPLVAVLLGWLIGGELLDPRIGLATGLIIGAVVLNVTPPKRTPSPPSGRTA